MSCCTMHIHHIVPCQKFLKHLRTKVEPRLDTNTDMHTLHSNIDIIVAGCLEMKNDHCIIASQPHYYH